MSAHPTQCDITLAGNPFISLPRHLPGRLNTDDFVFFNWPPSVNPLNYTVVVEANDTAGERYRSIAPLAKEVALPFVQFDAYAMIGVIPTQNKYLPKFWSRVNRGSTYNIPHVPIQNPPGQQYQMRCHGIQIAAVGPI